MNTANGGKEEVYNAVTAQWEAAGTSTAVGNATTAAAGISELATGAEITSGAATGGSGAPLVVTPDVLIQEINGSTAKGSVVAADKIAIADSAASGVRKAVSITDFKGSSVFAADTTQVGFVERATNLETLDGGTANVVPDADQIFDTWGYTISAGATYTAAQSAASVQTSETSYTKKKEIVCNRAGTYRIGFTLSTGAITTITGRIYKNGVAFGTERAVSNATTAFTEDLAFAAGDLIQIYAKQGAGTEIATVSAFEVKYAVTQNLLATVSSYFTVNL